jgi:RHS repeat-associated protein
MIEAAKEISSSFVPWCAEICISASECEGEKPHQGFAGENPAPHQGSAWSNSGTAIGLRGLGLENHVRSRCTGKERDSESGLDNFIKRYDSSSLGRFMSPDPQNAGAESEDPQSWNAYAYARNNPLTYTDPDGEKYQICDTSNHCTEISDEDFNNNFQNAKNVQLNGNQISIQDANGNFNKEGTFKRTSFDDLDANGNAFFNEMSARREPSLHAIEVFAVRSVTDSVGGAVLGKAIGAGVEAIQGARAASAAAAETTDLITQAASTVGNRGAVASSEAVATQAGEEWVGIGARPIYSRTGEVVGKISADGQRVYRITSIDKAQPYVNLENKATGGNLHVRF